MARRLLTKKEELLLDVPPITLPPTEGVVADKPALSEEVPVSKEEENLDRVLSEIWGRIEQRMKTLSLSEIEEKLKKKEEEGGVDMALLAKLKEYVRKETEKLESIPTVGEFLNHSPRIRRG